MELRLQPATLIKRYKRFLADITLPNDAMITVHIANTGAMTGCGSAGDIIWYSTSENSKRKYPHSWELTETASQQLICVNTIRANQLVEQALLDGQITELKHFQQLKREVRFGEENSKIDFQLIIEQQPVYIEVKSVTLLHECSGYFPDAKTLRGQKHLRELTALARQGQRAVLFFAALHTGISSVRVASNIDRHYADLLTQAIDAGVEVIAYKMHAQPTPTGFSLELTTPIAVQV